MKVYHSPSPGLVMGQVSRLERWHENFATGPFNAEREQRLLENAVRTAQRELDGMADRSGPTEQAIFLFQSMMLDDEGMMNEVRFCINAGISASAADDSPERALWLWLQGGVGQAFISSQGYLEAE